MIDLIYEYFEEAKRSHMKKQKIADILFTIGTCALVVGALAYLIWQLGSLDPLVAKTFTHIG